MVITEFIGNRFLRVVHNIVIRLLDVIFFHLILFIFYRVFYWIAINVLDNTMFFEYSNQAM